MRLYSKRANDSPLLFKKIKVLQIFFVVALNDLHTKSETGISFVKPICLRRDSLHFLFQETKKLKIHKLHNLFYFFIFFLKKARVLYVCFDCCRSFTCLKNFTGLSVSFWLTI